MARSLAWSGAYHPCLATPYLNGGKRFFFTKEGCQFVPFPIVSLRHIGSLGGLRDNSILDGQILLFRLNIVGCECYT